MGRLPLPPAVMLSQAKPTLAIMHIIANA